jgi:hypothetical protein
MSSPPLSPFERRTLTSGAVCGKLHRVSSPLQKIVYQKIVYKKIAYQKIAQRRPTKDHPPSFYSSSRSSPRFQSFPHFKGSLQKGSVPKDTPIIYIQSSSGRRGLRQHRTGADKIPRAWRLYRFCEAIEGEFHAFLFCGGSAAPLEARHDVLKVIYVI